MKIIIDNKIPYIKGALEPFADVVYLPVGKTTAADVKDADAIITRTRTLCNEELLAGSKVKFIATATIGFDHIDAEYCRKAGIVWANAPGCNARSVEQYIASALFTWALNRRQRLEGKTIGIVGVGNVGKNIARFCENIGMRVLLNDPPRERAEGGDAFGTLRTIQDEADIITFHVPLSRSGRDATFHMGSDDFISGLVRKPLLINSCRGEVFDTNAIIAALKNGKIDDVIIDCWENEPLIDMELLDLAFEATPHIAGYSKDGKANGTAMSVQALSRFFKLGIDSWQPENVELPDSTIIELDGEQRSDEALIAEAVLTTYNIDADDEALRNNPADFEMLRGDYPVRREFPAYTVRIRNANNSVVEKLINMGFRIEEV
ncbi:MAG: 4-phosphoerythronate dehydrogenase PdxB [Prolixibacteraceae bacterium]|nr:4-phosphoerythronate dehydrogenase PdxB [Prolixibacteraceae bacterium]